MADFFRSTPPASPTPPDDRKKQALMAQVQQELALANAQELMNKMNDKCFIKCITKPSTSLTSSEETCLTRCMDRYMEAFNIVSKTYASRIAREKSQPVDVLN